MSVLPDAATMRIIRHLHPSELENASVGFADDARVSLASHMFVRRREPCICKVALGRFPTGLRAIKRRAQGLAR
jgi:hypothetical protein